MWMPGGAVSVTTASPAEPAVVAGWGTETPILRSMSGIFDRRGQNGGRFVRLREEGGRPRYRVGARRREGRRHGREEQESDPSCRHGSVNMARVGAWRKRSR